MKLGIQWKLDRRDWITLFVLTVLPLSYLTSLQKVVIPLKKGIHAFSTA